MTLTIDIPVASFKGYCTISSLFPEILQIFMRKTDCRKPHQKIPIQTVIIDI